MAELTDAWSQDWPRVAYLAVFQYPVTQAIATVVQEITAAFGVFCPNTLYPTYGNFWVFVIEFFNMTVAIGAVVKFYRYMQTRMKARKGYGKLLVFNALVGLQWAQSVRWCTIDGV